jgi:hypothetical protein
VARKVQQDNICAYLEHQGYTELQVARIGGAQYRRFFKSGTWLYVSATGTVRTGKSAEHSVLLGAAQARALTLAANQHANNQEAQ